MKATSIVEAATSLLALFVAQLTTVSLDPANAFTLPQAQFVAPGSDVSWDSESLTVWLQDIGQGQPGAQFSGTYMPASVTNLYATFNVQILRAVAGLSGGGGIDQMMPEPEALMASALVTLNDAEQLLKAAVAIHANYSFTGPGEGYVIGPITPVGPEGGLVGTRCPIQVSVT